MRKAAVVFSAAALLTITAVSVPKPAEAGGGWGWGPGIAGGLIAGAIIGCIASSAYRRHHLRFLRFEGPIPQGIC